MLQQVRPCPLYPAAGACGGSARWQGRALRRTTPHQPRCRCREYRKTHRWRETTPYRLRITALRSSTVLFIASDCIFFRRGFDPIDAVRSVSIQPGWMTLQRIPRRTDLPRRFMRADFVSSITLRQLWVHLKRQGRAPRGSIAGCSESDYSSPVPPRLMRSVAAKSTSMASV